jgi:hypothetical protein
MIKLKKNKSKKNIEKRRNPRIPYSGNIFFATNNEFYVGRLQNYSKCGLFIETEVALSVGDIITIVLPYEQGEQTKCRGQIVRFDEKGYGIELLK